jgi:hypothetical protein
MCVFVRVCGHDVELFFILLLLSFALLSFTEF